MTTTLIPAPRPVRLSKRAARLMARSVTDARRSRQLDRLRGLAVALMLLDHALDLFHGPFIVRETITRLSMPIFFVLAGHLARRWTWRYLGIGALGIGLPMLAPWLDQPNVLLYLAVLCPLAAWARRRATWALYATVALALALAANGYDYNTGTGYQPLALAALVSIGALTPRRHLLAAGALLRDRTGLLAILGRNALRVYVAQALAFTALLLT